MAKCKEGHYYCYTDKKCKPIPKGFKVVGPAGMLRKENGHSVDDTEETKKNGNGNGESDVSEANKSGDSSLRDWFSKSRSSDGKPGWVQLGGKYAGKPCAKQPGQTTKPKCGSSKMKRNLSKDEEEAAFRRKNRKDPNPDRKGKAINVKTEETVLEKAGEKDACYHKVKSRYSVWPSAYASGALVKCRKVGAKNWGNKTKKEEFEFSDWRSEFKLIGEVATPKERMQSSIERSKSTLDMTSGQKDAYHKARGAMIAAKQLKKDAAELKKEEVELDEKCWKGYEKKGMKTMFGKRYPNCVKKEETECNHTEKGKDCPVHGQESCPSLVKEAVSLPRRTGQIIKAYSSWRGKTYMTKMFFPQTGIPSRTEVAAQIEKVYPGSRLLSYMKSDYEPGQHLLHTEEAEVDASVQQRKQQIQRKQLMINRQKLQLQTKATQKKKHDDMYMQTEGAAWTKKAGKSEKGGLNEKGRKSYERENPGSDLKAPSKKVGNPRRASFCARMKGMKKKLTSSKTANDPDSRINKSLRAWNC